MWWRGNSAPGRTSGPGSRLVAEHQALRSLQEASVQPVRQRAVDDVDVDLEAAHVAGQIGIARAVALAERADGELIGAGLANALERVVAADLDDIVERRLHL